jgi:predicted ATPase
VFALGIVLWEMLVGKQLFRGKTDSATLKAVRACEVEPPSAMTRSVPRHVDALVMKALGKRPADRFPTADAMREALSDVLAGLRAPEVVGWYRELDDVPGLDEDESAERMTEIEGEQTDAESEDSVETPHLHNMTVSGRGTLARARKLLSELAQRPTNLVPHPTSFVGRVAELADLHQLFRQGFKLLTLLGPGGTGKTRLASQFAAQLVSHYKGAGHRGGVWFVDLTDARDLDAICTRMAQALSVPLAPGDAVVQMGHVLASRGEVLVVVDNFEQLVAHAGATLGAWMEAAPEARFVVTSRTLLSITHETVFEVPPLRVPEKNDDVKKAEAVMLFVERARTARPGWKLTPADESAVAEIVRQLDGMPLAIELAAARMGMFEPAQLVQRLPRRFELLGAARGASERQATLRGAIDWSWQALQPQEASALAQLAVFRGGFSIEAAEAVVDAPSVMEVILALRSKSLVRAYFPRGDEPEPRYGLYESIREYALEKLGGSPDEAGAKARHTRSFLELGAKLSAGADSSVEQLDQLELERENLYAVFQRSVEGPAGPSALLAVLALDPLLTLRGPFTHHLLMLDAALGRVTDDVSRAAALEARGRARQARGKIAEAGEDYEEMLALARARKDRAIEGRAEFYIGVCDRLRGERRDARAHFEEALKLLREVGDRRMEGRALSNLAVLLHEMGLENDATASYLRALEIHRNASDRRYEGITLANLGVLQQAQGLLSQARAHYEEALAIHRELGNRRSEGISHINLGDLNRDLEKFGPAASHYESALAILREVGARRFEGVALFSMGSCLQEQGRSKEAASRLRDGIDALDEVGDRRYAGLARGALAGALAVEGADEPELLEDARRLLTEAGDPAFLDALDVYRALVDLAHVKRSGGNDPQIVQRVTKRLTHAEVPVPVSGEHPAGVPAPAERSEQVRAALRALRAAFRS